MMKLIVRSLDGFARLFYFAGRNRLFRIGVLALCALCVAGLIWARSAKIEVYWFDVVNGAALAALAAVAVGTGVSWVMRRADYVISIPFGLADSSATASVMAPRLLWFGSLGAGYGDVVLRQSPVSFKAIPAEARLTPAGSPDSWSVTIRKPRLARFQTVATSYGALPAIRLEFEDERGILRDGVIAAGKPAMRDTILDVLRYVGR